MKMKIKNWLINNKDIISLKYTDEKKKIYDNITISLKNSKIVMDIKTKESKLANLLQRLYTKLLRQVILLEMISPEDLQENYLY